jgi:drug/metabolite transporter (DMT)-like permease
MNTLAIGTMLVLLSTLVDGFGQTLLKKSWLDLRRRALWIALGVIFLILDVVFYTGALWFLPVSTAFPISGLSFVTAVLFSSWLLAERVTPKRWMGVVLIVVGAGLIVAYS